MSRADDGDTVSLLAHLNGQHCLLVAAECYSDGLKKTHFFRHIWGTTSKINLNKVFFAQKKIISSDRRSIIKRTYWSGVR